MSYRSSRLKFTTILSTVGIACGAFGTIPSALSEEIDDVFFSALEFRNIGPHRGGRVTTVEGVEGQPMTYYMGATGGGVWKTTNGGTDWFNISDGFFNVGSIGSIDVAKSDPNVIVVGTGASPVRGVASSHGDGIYRSTDAGETWKHIGLSNSRQIGTVRMHPNNPDIIYVAAQGSPHAPTRERGIYRSLDGGETWENVLFVNENTGGLDLKIDANNPRIIYATMWDHQRQPWEVRSGGEGSGIYKSTDGGATWNKLSEGLPELMGKIGVAVSPANSNRVWAIVEATPKGGLYRSDDGGKTWSLINENRRLHARSWYYMHITADPTDENTVYIMNSGMFRSIDGGNSVTGISVPHGDTHGLWINPDNAKNMINANDGGATVTYDGGNTWSSIYNQPTAQFYRVNADNLFPYNIYGGQQDNSAIMIASRGIDGGIGRDDYVSVGGCESAHVAFDPNNPRYVYAGCYLGLIEEIDQQTRVIRDVRVYPEIGFGVPAVEKKYRFNWNAPIVVSTHDPNVIYHAGNILLKSTDRGQSWTEVSPDLTRNEPEKQGPMGRPITNEVSENYNTIFYLAESHFDAGTLWAGTDDGLVQLTRDGGQTWNNITPRNTPAGMVNAIELSPHNDGTAFVAYTGYKYNDFEPHIYRTENYGRRWRDVTDGIPKDAFVRVVREDTMRPGLLYAGTETGLYISFDNGDNWQKFQQNLPIVPITDIKVHGDDLVLSTQGRAFWVLDNISPLRTMTEATIAEAIHLFEPLPAYDFMVNFQADPGQGENPDDGATIYYSLAEALDEDQTLTLKITDSDGKLVNSFDGDDLSGDQGLNRFNWDLSRKGFNAVDNSFTVLGRGEIGGFNAPPGNYTVTLAMGDTSVSQPLIVTQDPRSPIPDAAYAEQQEMLWTVYKMADELNASINSLRGARTQIKALMSRKDKLNLSEDMVAAGEALEKAITSWDESVFSGKREFFQDVLNWPDRLNAELLYFYGTLASAVPPLTPGIGLRFEEVSAHWTERMAARDMLVETELAAFNALYAEEGLDAIILDPFTSDEESMDD